MKKYTQKEFDAFEVVEEVRQCPQGITPLSASLAPAAILAPTKHLKMTAKPRKATHTLLFQAQALNTELHT